MVQPFEVGLLEARLEPGQEEMQGLVVSVGSVWELGNKSLIDNFGQSIILGNRLFWSNTKLINLVGLFHCGFNQ